MRVDGAERRLMLEYAPLDERLRTFLARLANVPAYYTAAKANVATPTREHTQLAIEQNRDATANRLPLDVHDLRVRKCDRCGMRRHGRRAYIRSVYFLPSLATLGNAVCGFGAMYVCTLDSDVTGPDRWTNFFSDYRFIVAAYLIFLSMVFDALDGPYRAQLVLGGNIRTGLEDHLYLPNGQMASSNGAMVTLQRKRRSSVSPAFCPSSKFSPMLDCASCVCARFCAAPGSKLVAVMSTPGIGVSASPALASHGTIRGSIPTR